MRTPLTYYGGKQRLLPELLRLLPPHRQYCEVFVGGAALFFAKPPSDNEVINDMDGRLTNFYWQMKTNFPELQKLIQATLHSEVHYENAKNVLADPGESDLRRAWAYWVRGQMAFSSIVGGGFAFGENGLGHSRASKRRNFTDAYMHRMEVCEIFNRDAVDIIKLKDSPNTFFYCDPPYVTSDQGGYKGYEMSDFVRLLEALKNIKGKFLLSSYPEGPLLEFRRECDWHFKDLKQMVGVSGKRDEKKYKVECLTWNYEEPTRQGELFAAAAPEAVGDGDESEDSVLSRED